MKAFVTSIGEKTTDVCIYKLKKYGFDVVLLNEVKPWIDKYKEFINLANTDCIRIDADIIVNENVLKMGADIEDWEYTISYSMYDMYQNNISLGGPVFYTKKALELIKANIDKITKQRPECSAVRISELNGHRGRRPHVIGIHGIYQDEETIKRAIKNKINRGQMDNYDFDLVYKLREIKLC